MNRFYLWKELLTKYSRIISASWKDRDTTRQKQRRSELEFLPAVLEIQHTPPHPLPRVVLKLLCTFILAAFIWAVVGNIDIIASAEGKIIPSGYVKYIQPITTANVRHIYVTDGQYVKESQLLIELDATMSHADVTKLTNDNLQAQFDAIRYQNLLNQLDNKALVDYPVGSDLYKQEMVLNSKNQFKAQWLELQDKLQSIKARQSSLNEAIRTSNAIITKYNQTLPILKEKESDYLELYNKKFMSQHGYLDVSKQRIDLQQSLAEEEGKVREIRSQIQEQQRQYQLTISDFRMDIGEKLLLSKQKQTATEQDLIKAQEAQNSTRLLAPESGYVQQLAVHTVGGVVTPAQPLMVIVPKDGGITVEAQLENKDIGFVHPDQDAEIKVAAFPFTRYGTVHGKVISVSADAIEDQKQQLRYKVYIRLDKTSMIINGSPIALTPGMMITAEIKTGKRKLIDYFLSPLIQNTTEALHER